MADKKYTSINQIPADEQKLIDKCIELANAYQLSDEYAEIARNYAYYEGGSQIELSLRGGYKAFDRATVPDKDTRCSPKSDTLWRAPAQGDEEPWLDFARRRLEYVNYSQMIAQKRGSLLYKKPPVRTIDGPLAKQMDSVYADPHNESHTKFVTYHRNAILSGTVAVIPWWIPEGEGRVEFRGYPRHTFVCAWDANDKMTAFCRFGTDLIDGKKFWQVWTFEGVYQIKEGKVLEKFTPHYCGDELPVCLFRESTDDLVEPYYGTIPATDIVQSNENLNVKLSELKRVAQYQSFSVLMTTNVGGEVVIAPGARINAKGVSPDRPVTAEYLNPEAQIEQLEAIIRSRVAQLFETGRIPKAVIFPEGDGAESGVHLMIQWHPVLELFRENAVTYTDNERRLNRKLAVTLARWAEKSPVAPIPEHTLDVDFDEESVIPEDAEGRLAREEWDLSMGLKSPVQIMMERNPDLTENEAIEYLEHVKDLNERIGFTPGGKQNGEFGKEKGNSVEDLFADDEEELV